MYLLLAVLTYFFFFHHPSHIGIQVRKSKDNVINIGFNVDKTTSWFGNNNQDNGSEPTTVPRTATYEETGFSGITEVGGNRNKLDVTLIDAFRIKELNLLIVSYLFRQTHNSFIKGNSDYAGADKIDDVYYSIGAIVGLISTGIFVDTVIKNKNFLTIFILNIVLFLWDIYLFIEAKN